MISRAISILLVLSLSGCGNSCGYDASLSHIRSLSQSDFASIHSTLQAASSELEDDEELRINQSDLAISELSKIQLKLIRLDQEHANIVLGSCYDDKAILHIKGLKRSEKSINISWGEHPLKTENLWKTSN